MFVKQRRYKLCLLLVVLGLTLSLVACGPGARPQIWGLGDVSVDGLVDNADMDIIAQALGSRSGDANWNPEADLDLNGKVDIADLAIAGRSYGSTHNFHFPRPLSNRNKAVSHFSVAIDASDRLHVVWTEHAVSKGRVYYTRLDRFGNTLVDDLLLDSGSAVADEGAGVACDAAGNAYIAWEGPGGLCQARVDQWGYLVLGEEGESIIDTRPIRCEPAVAVDSSGRAHVHYLPYCSGSWQVYAAVTDEGALAIRIEGLPAFSNFPGVIVDADDNVHWLYEREVTGPNPLSYGRYSYGDTPSLPERNITSLQHKHGASRYNRPAMATDASGNAFIIWTDYRDGNLSLYLEKVVPDGSSVIDDHLLWAGFQTGGAGNADLALDAAGYVHVISPGYFRSTYGPYHLAYGIFDNNAEVISPMRWAVYGKEPRAPRIVVDSQGDAHILYAYIGSNGNLYYQSTAFDAAAYDRSRPDLGVDVAHLNWEPFIARWGQDLEVTAKVFNAGWAASPTTKARISIMLSPDVILPPPAQAEVDIPALNPGENQDITATLQFPQMPPSGFESLEYVRLLIEVDPDNTIAETTEANNNINTPLMVQPLPTTAGLFLIVQDDTETVLGRDGVPVLAGTATISGGGIDRQVAVSDYITILADDLPVGPASEPKAYTVSWSDSGYSTPSPASVTIGRNANDPYIIDYDPENTVLLHTDRWGSLSGQITAKDSGAPLSGATVRIEGQGISIETTTDTNGNFSPASKEELGKLIPGSYEIRVSKADYARVTGQVTIQAFQEQIWNQAMEPTTKAYVHGRVINQYGRPVANADVTACDISTQTNARGIYDLGEVEANCRTIEVSCPDYDSYSKSVSLRAGLERIVGDIELQFDPPASVACSSGGLASWAQDESSADLLPDPPEDATWLEKEMFKEFSDTFWPSYRVQVWWGCYEHDMCAIYSGPTSDRHLQQVQVRIDPKTFEAHRVSGKGEIKVSGHSIKVELGVFQDSGVLSAVRVIEARLVDADSGTVIKTVKNTIEGGSCWNAFDEEVRTYDFGSVKIDDWNNAEVWIYLKVGKNEGGEWTSSPILRGWHFDQQVLRLKLSNPDDSYGDYVLVDFPRC